MSMGSERTYWFGRKRIGWGVGPRSWQGWLVTAVYVVVLISLRHVGMLRAHHSYFVWIAGSLTVAYLAVVVWKCDRLSKPR